MENLILLFVSLAVISLVSLIGVFTLSLKHNTITKYLDLLVSLSVGAMLGGAFLHLLPELIEEGFSLELSATILLGIVIFFVIEKFISWHHCHRPEHTALSFTYMNLIGDGLHNFLDGLVLAGAFLLNPGVGIATAIAIFLHELPQEIGDFGVLLKGGFTKKKAIISNFLISLTAFMGAGVTLIADSLITGFTPYAVALAIGGFIYIAGTDLIPELHKCEGPKDSIMQLVFILIGIVAMFLLLFLE